MPIHINLLAEAQAAEELRRHDPVKRAIFIGATLVVLSLVWSGIVKINTFLEQERYAGVQGAINAQTNAFQQVEVNLKKIAAIRLKLTALQKLQAARFLQGNLLDALQHATVEGVQLTHLHLDQSYVFNAGKPAQTNDSRVIPGKPATVKEKIIVRLEARDYSANPGDQVNTFKNAIAKSNLLSNHAGHKPTACNWPILPPRLKLMEPGSVCDVHAGLPFSGGDPMKNSQKRNATRSFWWASAHCVCWP